MTACVGTQGATTTTQPPTPTTTSSIAPSTAVPTSTTAPELDLGDVDTGDINGFGLTVATLDGESIVLAVADDASLRSRGLMGVTDFGDVNGMLFTWGGDVVTSRFTMRDTLVPLTIAFFDVDGALVDAFDMVPCTAEPCPPYAASEPYAFAVEFQQGRPVASDAILALSVD